MPVRGSPLVLLTLSLTVVLIPSLCPHTITTSPSHPTVCITLSHSRVPILFISPHHSALSPDSYTLLDPIVIAVASVAVTLLLSAASCWIIKKGQGLWASGYCVGSMRLSKL